MAELAGGLLLGRKVQYTAARPIHRQGWNTWRQKYTGHVCFETCAMMPSIVIAGFSEMNRVRRNTVTAAGGALQLERLRKDARPRLHPGSSTSTRLTVCSICSALMCLARLR